VYSWKPEATRREMENHGECLNEVRYRGYHLGCTPMDVAKREAFPLAENLKDY